MLLTSVVLVLREVLEAALIVSVLLALSRVRGLGTNWLGWAVGLGLAGAVTYAINISVVSDWFDGVGQEVVNAFMQLVLYVLLVAFAILTIRPQVAGEKNVRLLHALMTVSVALAITREGSEIMVYLTSFTQSLDQFTPILTGGMVGLGIGLSVGAITYYVLLSLRQRLLPHLCSIVLAIVAAGLAGQAAQLLIQADWLPAQNALWDTSAWLPEGSLAGQLLYALLGYEATPTPLQAAIYFVALLIPLSLLGLFAARRESPSAA